MPGRPMSSRTISGRNAARRRERLPARRGRTRDLVAPELRAGSPGSRRRRGCRPPPARGGEPPAGSSARSAARRAGGGRAGGERQADDELAALARPVADAPRRCRRAARPAAATSVRPMPSPPSERSSGRSPCMNSSKIAGSRSAAMPTPVSRDADRHHRLLASRPSAGCRPPGGVYLAALLSRFVSDLREPGRVALDPQRLVGQRGPSGCGRGRRSAGGSPRRRASTTCASSSGFLCAA